jgi:uncharacterized protein DUF6881
VPGGVVRTKTPGGLNWQVVPDITTSIYPMLQYLDAELETRAGLSRHTQGYQPNFESYSLVPVDYDPFGDSGGIQQAPTQLAQVPIQSPQTPPQGQQAQFQQPQIPIQPAQPGSQSQPQQPATGAIQPGVNGTASGNIPGGSSGGGIGDGRMLYADPEVEFEETGLSTEPLPSLEQIAKHSQFEPEVISKAEFEKIWARATA